MGLTIRGGVSAGIKLEQWDREGSTESGGGIVEDAKPITYEVFSARTLRKDQANRAETGSIDAIVEGRLPCVTWLNVCRGA